MDYSIADYEKQAAEIFPKLLKYFKEWGNGWQVGNVFDTLTDYIFRYPEQQSDIGEVVRAAEEQWGKIQGSMCWYDDWGWWGIASVKAFDSEYEKFFEPYVKVFQDRANLTCWNTMIFGKAPTDKNPYKYKGGPNVWDNRDDGSIPGYFTSSAGWAAPRFPGGVWQYDMWQGVRKAPECTPNHDPEHDEDKLSDPKSPHCPLGPYQLTVMNGLYFELALRLLLKNEGKGTPKAVYDELAFLVNWINLLGDHSLLQRFSDDITLVRERVATYASPQGNEDYPLVEGYHPGDAWCGDQGLILGGLLDFLLTGAKDPHIQALAIAVARGVLLRMVDANNVVMPYSRGFDVHNDPDDYSCGSGVFWRYLLRGFNQNAALRKEVLDMIRENPTGNPIVMSADNPYAHAPFNHDLFREFNALSVLLTAIEILKEANK